MSDKSQEVNIQTFLRVRPSKKPSGYFTIDDIDTHMLNFNLPDNFKSADYVNNSKLKHAFQFTDIIPMEASQDDVFRKVGMSAVKNALEGFNSTIFAYGQTGSGKTFTLTGGPERYADRGLIPRSISMIFNEVRNRTDMEYKIYISYLEIYNEQGYDLLESASDTKALEDLPKVAMLEDEFGNFHLKNLSMHVADSEEDALNLLFEGDTNRAIAETPMNMASSRSHCIFTISLEGRVIGSATVRRSKLHLVDLAGSERVAKTNSSGSVLKEAKYINTSLFYLEMVIVALYEKATKGRTHVPYRNSMMTSALRDSLGGNCKTIMVATINPEASHTDESISTCRFAQRVSLIKNKASINEDKDPNVIIQRLKTELLSLREEIAFLKDEAGEGDMLAPQEIEDLKIQCRSFVDNPDPMVNLNIGKLTLTKIKDVFAIMKNLVLESRASASTGGGGKKDYEYEGYDSKDQNDFIEQIKDLKSCLLQRDNEIAILVNMVKKGKTAEDVNSASRGGSRMSSQNNTEITDEESPRSWKFAQEKAASNQNNNIPLKSVQQQSVDRQQAREKLIIDRHLFGIPPPNDPKVFEDAAASFEWFRERCSLNSSIEENKELLKDKINTAKVLGERANQSRNTINYLKNSIEAIRKEKALERINNLDAKEDDVESPEEETYRRAIEQEKGVYKESFETLRVLKPEIEHIRKILENCRMKMQTQFDEWFNNLHSRNFYSAENNGQQFNNATSVDNRGSVTTNSAPGRVSNDSKSTPMFDDEDNVVVTKVKRLDAKHSDSSKSAEAPRATNTIIPPGKDDEDDDVNEDIMKIEFYQAKEELLKRRKAV